ncbi:hypothetical protein D6779_06640 [Candidatus Parcubacteria bacterium]|nr:MAG: hypothetical protein D6779_06640 [Candidatus Parcubacteria bacterium]
MTNKSYEWEALKVSNDAIEKASVVSRCVRIQDVRLVDHGARINFLRHALPDAVRVSQGFGFKRDDENGVLKVDLLFECQMAYSDDEESKKNPPISIRAVFNITYKVDNLRSFDEEHLRAFAEVNGIYNAWPYWRELLHSDLARMGLPALIAPSLRIEQADANE